MRYRFNAFPFLLLAILTLTVASCSDKTTESEANDLGPANMLARQGMEQLNQVIIDLGENQPDINGSDDIMQESTFNQIKDKFDAALVKDADNPMANLGLSILDIVRINYDDELWAMIHDADSMDTGSKRIINNQFQFLAGMPLRLMKQVNVTKSGSVSIMRMQDYIKTSVLPKLGNAITHLSNAVALADSNSLLIDTGEEMMEVDLGEIYAFRASVYAVTAAFNLMVAYNWDMIDSGGAYGWQTELSNVHVQPVDTYSAYHYEKTTC